MLLDFILPLAKQPKELGFSLYSPDALVLLVRLAVNIVVLTILIRYLYYPKTKRKDYLFTYYLIGTITDRKSVV